MDEKYWEKRILEFVNKNDRKGIRLISQLLDDSEKSKQVLRNKGYGWTGLSLLETVIEEVPPA